MNLKKESKKFSLYNPQYKYDSFLSDSRDDIAWMRELVKFLLDKEYQKFCQYDNQSVENSDPLPDFLVRSGDDLNIRIDDFLEAYKRLNQRLFERVIKK
ncbi:MAG: hypothetical protein J7647_23150 [Cyanobacteria bacterium SBLK]|nr:hypothetical protein [Cyanobacteria bacterium SBLK]